ncbi:hypothetical protein ANN_19241 [Periplaneta americana]|uniref:Reverse transcriptase domain-containing protein n=1 Tax=Periplaneta americana TaxID=6978 RepID=A0ABQ8S9T3_PERAM|nr:hypothetical protein ANN_19241 [Periplaneta americana]
MSKGLRVKEKGKNVMTNCLKPIKCLVKKDDRVENKSSADNAEPTEENGADDADPREDNGTESGTDAENDQQPENELLAEDEYEWMNLTSKDKIQWRRSVIFPGTIPIWQDHNGGEDILDLPYPITFFKLRKFLHCGNILDEPADSTDRFWKIRTLYDSLRTRCKELVVEHEVDLAACNSWLEYQADAENLGICKNKTLDLLHFRMRIGEALIKQEKEITTKRGRPSNIDPKEPQTTKILKTEVNSIDENIVRNGNIKIGDLSFEEVEKFKYLGATVTNINDTREEIKRRINMGNACYYSVEKLLSSSLLSKNLKVRIYKTIILPVLLYGCETWTLTLREEHRLRVFENKVLRKIFGAKRDEVTGEWRKLHNTELHALYSSPDIIRNIKSRRLRWAGHVARMGESRNAYRVLVGRPEEKDL